MKKLKIVQEYDSNDFLRAEDIKISNETERLLEEASKTFKANFDNKLFLDKCIFLSYYCSVGDCSFCYRTVHKENIKDVNKAKRSLPSVMVELLFCKVFNWNLAFLTGGYGIFPFEDLVEICKNAHNILGNKIWLNMGILSNEQLEKLRPYVNGICASMETLNPELHEEVCPSKPIKPYVEMFSRLDKSFKRGAAVIVGLGEEREDIKHLFDFIENNKIDTLTLYALKPVNGTVYKKGPSSDEFLWWLAATRVKFPKLEIIAGTNLRRCEEAGYYVKAGVNGITKFPATKQFGTEKARKMVELIKREGREFVGELVNADGIDFYAEVDRLKISDSLKIEMKEKLPHYLDTIFNPKEKDLNNCSC